jgi:hypothetical protein
MASAGLKPVPPLQSRPIDSVPEDLFSYLLLTSTGAEAVRGGIREIVASINHRVATDSIRPDAEVPGGWWVARGRVSNDQASESPANRRAQTLKRALGKSQFSNFLQINPELANYGKERRPGEQVTDRSPKLPSTDRYVIIAFPHRRIAGFTSLGMAGLTGEALTAKKAELKPVWADISSDIMASVTALRESRHGDVRCMRHGISVVHICMTAAELVYWNQVLRQVRNVEEGDVIERPDRHTARML